MVTRARSVRRILMLGPALSGQGGIARVVTTWRDNNFFDSRIVSYIATTAASGDGRITALLQALARYIVQLPRSDLVYVHTASGSSFFRKSVFLVIALLFQKKAVLHVHPTSFFDRFVPELAGLAAAYARTILRRVSAFVVLTEHQCRGARRLVAHVPVFVVRNPVDFRALTGSDELAREGDLLLYLGWYIPQKGVFELVDAVESLVHNGRAIRVEMYGTKGAEELRRVVASKGLADVISIGDWIGLDEKVRALKRATLFVFPSHNEGIPNAVLEAMATKTPIISTNVGGLAEILRDGENALICRVRDPEHLRGRIVEALADPALRNRLADAAYLDALSKYEPSVVRQEFERALQAL